MTTFTVMPGVDSCLVRIEMTWEPATGMVGLVERLVGPRMLRSLLEDELERLDRYAREQAER